MAFASDAYEKAEMWMPLATSSYGASKNGLMPIPVCGMKPMECTTPSSLLPSPITSVTRSAKRVEVLLVLHVELEQRRLLRQPVGDALDQLHPVETGEHQFRTGLLRDLGDVECDRRVRDDPRDEDPLAFENACHIQILFWKLQWPMPMPPSTGMTAPAM